MRFIHRQTITQLLSGISKRPACLRYAFPWASSVASPRSPLQDGNPWIPYEARNWLESLLKPDMTIFEWGSGGSTVFFASRVRKVVSVEHDSEWHKNVLKALADRGIDNVDYNLFEPRNNEPGSQLGAEPPYTSSLEKYSGMNFERYARFIDQFPDQKFDIVLVDGRSRASCVEHALSKVRAGGYLVLDNSERKKYSSIFTRLSSYSRTDKYGLGPYIADCWQTTFWQIDSA